jgi:hypothetical protein
MVVTVKIMVVIKLKVLMDPDLILLSLIQLHNFILLQLLYFMLLQASHKCLCATIIINVEQNTIIDESNLQNGVTVVLILQLIC